MHEPTEYAASAESLPKRTIWVVKIGSAVLAPRGSGFNESVLTDIVDQICTLRATREVAVILVTSGAVAEGARRLGWMDRPSEIHKQQAAASVGQPGLMRAYDELFRRRGTLSAQILLTHDDLARADRHRNAMATLRTLLDLDVVPIVNENDAVGTEEIRVGDNDMLAALVANICAADRLVLVTDRDGICAADSGGVHGAQTIRSASIDDHVLSAAGGEGPRQDRRGTASKVRAARMFALSGGTTFIVDGQRPRYLLALQADPTSCGTRITPGRARLAEHAQWLVGMRRTAGSIVLHDDAVPGIASGDEAVRLQDIRRVNGSFRCAELVRIVSRDGTSIARGLCNFDSTDLSRGLLTKETANSHSDEVIHRENLIRVEI